MATQTGPRRSQTGAPKTSKIQLLERDYTKDYQNRPARKQAEFAQTQSAENSGTFNIWYSKWSGDGSRFGKGVERAQTRCILERDAGKTKAGKKSIFCIHFAHGCCSKGKDCTFLHRIPMEKDRFETTVDCFGRDKHRIDRDDMGGVGSFERQNTTLYVGHVGINDNMETFVRKHFSEWGEIEHINVLTDKGVAFVRYKNVANAEFAKEAMYGQSLDHGEALNVRWATEDPNPRAVKDSKRKAEEMVEQAVKSKLPVVGEHGTVADYDRMFKNQKLDAAGPTADEVAQTHRRHALVAQGGAYYATDAAAAYYNHYAAHGYVPAPDGKSFVYDPAQAAAAAAYGYYGASEPQQEQPQESVEYSASSAYAIPLPKKTKSESQSAPEPQNDASNKQESKSANASKSANSSKPKAAPLTMLAGYGSDDDDQSDP